MASFDVVSNVRIAALACSLLVAASAGMGDAHAGVQKPHSSFYPIKGTHLSSQTERRWQPLLKIDNGCHPYPAVDPWGNWSGGLQEGGWPSSECNDSSRGQIYARGRWFGTPGTGKCAVMYSWYFPKDNGAFGAIGHRHDWEAVILWIKAGGCTPTGSTGSLYAVSYSSHGNWYTRYGARGAGNGSNGVSSDGHLKVKYTSGVLGFGTHGMAPTDDHHGSQALVDYDLLWKYGPSAAKALSSVYWGRANFPLKDTNFNNAISEAWPSGF